LGRRTGFFPSGEGENLGNSRGAIDEEKRRHISLPSGESGFGATFLNQPERTTIGTALKQWGETYVKCNWDAGGGPLPGKGGKPTVDQ